MQGPLLHAAHQRNRRSDATSPPAHLSVCRCDSTHQSILRISNSTGIEHATATFAFGDWNLVEKRYGFDGDLIQANRGTAHFSKAMAGKRLEELQTLLREEGETASALQVFVYDPRANQVEIARTDSGHYGFWVITGKPTPDWMELKEKYPDPESEITRRITYTCVDRDHFTRRLEFSQDNGNTFFTRSEWLYSRKSFPALFGQDRATPSPVSPHGSMDQVRPLMQEVAFGRGSPSGEVAPRAAGSYTAGVGFRLRGGRASEEFGDAIVDARRLVSRVLRGLQPYDFPALRWLVDGDPVHGPGRRGLQCVHDHTEA